MADPKEAGEILHDSVSNVRDPESFSGLEAV
jgi:hypothetical protein